MGDMADPASVLRRRVPGETPRPVGGSHGEACSDDHLIPPAKWTFNKNGVPQAIAHRGYKVKFPENTMGAFRGAIEAGAHALETDLHLSKDNVVVISHDKDLKRCYGEDGLVCDHDWAYLATLRTLREPRQPMPRLSDLLSYLAEPGNESTWLLLDIKIDDDARTLISRLAATIAAAPPGGAGGGGAGGAGAGWTQRIVLGCWTARHLRLCHELLPDFAIAWIGITLALAREPLKVPNVAMNMRQEPLYGFGGRCFIRECQAGGRPLYAWPVNKEGWMRWAIGRKLDGVITDDPKKYLEVCDKYRQELEKGVWNVNESEGMVARVRDFVSALYLLVLVGLVTRQIRYHERVGGIAETRELLKGLSRH